MMEWMIGMDGTNVNPTWPVYFASGLSQAVNRLGLILGSWKFSPELVGGL
jgi:hypothetical protein